MKCLIPFYVWLAYVLTGFSETCLGIGSLPINNESDCKTIIETMSKTYIGIQSNRNYPTGCFLYNNYDAYFNEHENGSGHGNVNAICKGKLT